MAVKSIDSIRKEVRAVRSGKTEGVSQAVRSNHKSLKSKYKYGNSNAFKSNQRAKKVAYNATKRRAERKVVQRQRKQKQTKRGVVSGTLDALSAPLSAVATPIYNKLEGRKTNVFKDVWSGLTAAKNRPQEMRTFSDVFDAYQDYQHRHGRNTRMDNLMLRMGRGVYDNQGRVVSPETGTREGLRNHNSEPIDPFGIIRFDPYRTTRGVAGLAGDLTADPLNFVGGAFKIPGKIIKGSGASLSRLKEIGGAYEGLDRVIKTTDDAGRVIRTPLRPGEVASDVVEGANSKLKTVQAKRTRDVLQILYTDHNATQRAELLSGVSEEGIYQRLKDLPSYSHYTDDQLREVAKDSANTFRTTYLNMPKTVDRAEISLGLKNKPFQRMRSTLLNAKVSGDEFLRKVGDQSIAPYYNELAQRLSASRVGRAISPHSKIQSKVRQNYSNANDIATLQEIKSKQGLADANLEVMEKADLFNKQFNELSTEEQLNIIDAIEKGDLEQANKYFHFRNEAAVNPETAEITEEAEKAIDQMDVNKTKIGIQSTINNRRIAQKNASEILRRLNDQGVTKFTPAQYLFYKMNGKMPNLSTSDKEVIDIYNLLTLNSKYRNLDVGKTLFNAYNNAMDRAAQIAMGRINTGVSRSSSIFDDSGKFTRLGLVRKQLESGDKTTAEIFDDLARYLGADDTYQLIKDYAVFNDALKAKEAALNDYRIGNVIDDIYADPVVSHAYQSMRTRGMKDGELLAAAYEAIKAEALKADVSGVTTDGLDEAKQLVDIVQEKLGSASRSEKNLTFEDVLLDLSDDIKGSMIDAFTDTAQGHRAFINKSSGVSFIDEYNYFNNLTVRDVLTTEENEFLDKIGKIESIINPDFKANSFSETLRQADSVLDKLDLYEAEFDRLRSSAAIFGLDDTNSMYQLARGFENEMERIGRQEVVFGELSEGQFESLRGQYFPRIMTDEAKRINAVNGHEFEQNGAFSDVFSRGANFGRSRISPLTVSEMNERQGYEYFKTNLAQVYLERALKSNQLIYADSATNFLFDKFADPVSDAGRVLGSNISDGVNQYRTLSIPFNRLDKFINQRVGKQVSSDAYKWAEQAADTFINNISANRGMKASQYGIREFEDSLKETNEMIDTIRADLKTNGAMSPVENELIQARREYEAAREAEKAGTGSREVTEALGEKYNRLYEEKEDFLLQENPAFATLHELYNDADAISHQIETLRNIEKKMNLEVFKTSGRIVEGGIKKMPGDLTRDELIEAYKNIYMRDQGNQLFQEYKTSMVDDLFGSADDADRRIARRRQCYSTNIPVQELTEEQAQKIRTLYNDDDKFFEDICQFDSSILDMVNTMSRSQELAGMHSLLKAYDTFMLSYKRLNTLVDPSFHVQNGLSNAFQSYLATSAKAFDPIRNATAYRILKANPEDAHKVITLGGKDYTYRQLNEYMKQFGVIDESFTRFEMAGGSTDELVNDIRQSPAIKNVFKNIKGFWNIEEDASVFQKINSASPVSWYMQFSGNIGQNLETTQRANLFLNSLDEGQTIKEAAQTVNKYMFDYGDLTWFEQNVLKRAIPFYTFMRKNIPMELETLLTKPRKFSGFAHLEDELNNEQEDSIMPNWRNRWRQNYLQIPGLGDGQWGVDPKLPFEQLDRLDPQSMDTINEPRALGMLAGSLTPFLKLPIEYKTNTNQYVDMPIVDESKGENPREEYVDWLLRNTIPGNIVADIMDDGTGDETKDYQNDVKDVSSHLAFPFAHIYDMGDYKNYTNTFPDKQTGEPVTVPSYLSQEENDQLYANTYLSWNEEDHRRDEEYYSRAYDAYSKSYDFKKKGRPSFQEVLEQWHVKQTSYEEYKEYCEANGLKPKTKEQWKKDNTYRYVEA